MGRRVFSVETERDKDLHVLAVSMAKCMENLRQGRCVKEQCQCCGTLQDIAVCMKELPACDKLRVNGTADEIFGRMCWEHPTKEEHEEFNREYRRKQRNAVIFWALFALLAFPVVCALFGILIMMSHLGLAIWKLWL